MQAWLRQASEGRKRRRRLPSPQGGAGGDLPPRRRQPRWTASKLTRLVLEEQDGQAGQQSQEQEERQDQQALLRLRPLRPAALPGSWPAEVHLGEKERGRVREAAAPSATGPRDMGALPVSLPEPSLQGDRRTARHPHQALSCVPGATSCLGTLPFRGKGANGPRTAMGRGAWGHSSPEQRRPREATHTGRPSSPVAGRGMPRHQTVRGGGGRRTEAAPPPAGCTVSRLLSCPDGRSNQLRERKGRICRRSGEKAPPGRTGKPGTRSRPAALWA